MMWVWLLIFFPALALAVPSGKQKMSAEHFELFKQGSVEYIRTKQAPTYFLDVLKLYQFPGVFRETTVGVYDSPTVCNLCNTVTDLIIGGRKLGLSRETLIQEVRFICTRLGIESERVCDGVLELNVDVFIYIIDNYANFTSDRFCGVVLQSSGCSPGTNFDWSIMLPSGSSPPKSAPTDSKAESLKILHLSDIHYDPEYYPGGNAACGEPICCQRDQGSPPGPADACGFWSDYRDADSPWHLVQETINQAKTQKIDFVYYTGDVISHRVWDTSIEKNTQTITQLYDYFKENFDVPVFPVFGNHEPHPLNIWPPLDIKDDRFDVRWLFELAAKSWSELIGQNVSETVLKGGYYSVSPKPGFRVIGLNTNLGYVDNWWLMYEDFDPFQQLQWLADTLKQAEDNNESVHLISHIPDSLAAWSREYARIVERFANTITGQFNGHTHTDEFHVYYNSSGETQAVGVAFNGASVTPFSNNNPSFKYYYVDRGTFSLLDYEEWTFNLTLANSQPTSPVEWYQLYSFVEEYGVANLLPAEIDKLLYKMTTNHTLIDDYFRFTSRNSDPGIRGGCDGSCQRNVLCSIATTVYGDHKHCDRFQGLYNQP